jgi:hypothetical protein
MDFNDVFRALWMAALPLFLLSFGLVWWALHRGRLEGSSVSELQRSIQSLGKSRKDKERPQKVDPALEKWFRFGGGFYGLVALYTWLLIEWDEVWGFLTGLGDIVIRVDIGGLISLVIGFFIESIMNFVAAIAWPIYWLGEARYPWLWIILAYGGYWLGIKSARRVFGDRSPTGVPTEASPGLSADRDLDQSPAGEGEEEP